ncbi:hypothetical protein SCLCIDRAFT_285091 [Scleroderma citrinum Foug A]|uniref:Uncharacterized protein n=1 Tax=Scleroderma citrinum Foug A TaxID=1036808 RepID=A0A0C3DHB2_9AGAM|nr:hypothetical protein SCLCIDRAFT_285091 [Scleroderma citrinum Foug A]
MRTLILPHALEVSIVVTVWRRDPRCMLLSWNSSAWRLFLVRAVFDVSKTTKTSTAAHSSSRLGGVNMDSWTSHWLEKPGFAGGRCELGHLNLAVLGTCGRGGPVTPSNHTFGGLGQRSAFAGWVYLVS